MDWTALSPRARETLGVVALRLAIGRRGYDEIAEETGLTKHAISDWMREVRAEIRGQLES